MALCENMFDNNVRFISGNGEIIKVKICGNENISCWNQLLVHLKYNMRHEESYWFGKLGVESAGKTCG